MTGGGQARGASGSDYLKSLPLYVLPQHAISSLTYALTRVRAPWFKNRLIRAFARHYRVNMDEALHPDPEDYADFNAFFIRSLRDGARVVEGDATTLVSPADGQISRIGSIERDAVFQAKGHQFSATELLGGDSARATAFQNGGFVTVYLSPRDYHRVHMPLTGRLLETVYIPGRLYSVAPHTTRSIPGLFARNERLACIFETDVGPMALVLVGAINVAAIETVWSGLVTPPRRSRIEVEDFRDAAVELERGSEMGRFNMGSTVILLFGPDRVRWLESLRAEQPLKMGQRIGRLVVNDNRDVTSPTASPPAANP